MKPLHTFLVFLVLATLPASSLANVFADCAQDNVAPQEQASLSNDLHAHHTSMQPDSQTAEENSVLGDCTCCGDCALMCPASGCGVAGIIMHSVEASFACGGQFKMHAELRYASPAPHPLFRPPIRIG